MTRAGIDEHEYESRAYVLPGRRRRRCCCALARPALAFTPEQAAAGRATYEQNCVACHGPNLRQLPGAVLAGPEFVAKWGERGTNELLAQARATMPPDRPGRAARGDVSRR